MTIYIHSAIGANEYILLDFNLAKSAYVEVNLYSIIGNKLDGFIVNKQFPPGNITIRFDLAKHKIANGTYFLSINAGNNLHHKKITVF